MNGGRRDFWTHYESRIDEQIRLATEAGAFDDLPGTGRPLNLPARDDETWWVREKMRREGIPLDALLPLSLQLRKEIERLPETVRDLPDEAAVRRVVADLNRRVARFVTAPSGPSVPVRPVRVEDVVARWAQERASPAGRDRAGRGRAARDAAPDPSTPAPQRRRRWWRWADRG